MSNSVSMFNVAKSGMMATKAALSTTGHNIANVNTEGFSRQTLDQAAAPTIPSGKVTFGTGVRMKDIKRVNDEYLERRLHAEAKNFGNVEEKDTYLHQTEQIFNESNSDGLNRLASKFFNEFRKLSSDPANEAIRSSVRESSNQLVADVRRMDRSLKEVQRNIDNRIAGYVTEINSTAKEIRDLNLLIERGEMEGSSMADLCDQRDVALKKLGAMADISVSKDERNKVTVTMAGHIPIVEGDQLTKFEVMRTPADPERGKAEGALDIVVNEPVPAVITGMLRSGRLGGLLEVRDRDIGEAQNRINEIAYRIATDVNEVHAQGYGKDGLSGRDYFAPISSKEHAAETLDLSDNVKENLSSIAAAKTLGAASDNRIALAISALGDMKDSFGNDGSILDDYNSMVSEIAVKTASNSRAVIFQKDVLSQIENMRESQSGVSLDEETANLIKYQHAYAANAKVMQVADEIMQTLIGAFK